jgi:hypothetical protein
VRAAEFAGFSSHPPASVACGWDSFPASRVGLAGVPGRGALRFLAGEVSPRTHASKNVARAGPSGSHRGSLGAARPPA